MKTRPRINRWTEARRNLLFGDFSLQSLVQPHFVVNGSGIDNPIEGMDGIHQQSVDILIQTIRNDYNNGIRSVMLFGIVNSEDKDEQATKASDASSHMHEAIRKLKSEFGDSIVVMTDVCLCTATNHGHCGLVEHGHIVNDASVERLCEIAVSHAEAGADYVCASDMMDGRVSAIRSALEAEHHSSTGVLSYSVKYASSFYGPFRHAADSSPEFGDRSTHQMNINSGYGEATLEAMLDEEEGADIIMVKPGLPYLDVLRRVADSVHRPIAVYNVSGEYSMVMNVAKELEMRKQMVCEIMTSFKRAGAQVVITYHAREIAKHAWMK
ncbi:MAG: porphobilinogen synthase [Euryarchaeota archaeon]|nr:porphobilinogen synthase [Euryarchaeota archaeon]